MKPWSTRRGHWWALCWGGLKHWAWTFPKSWLESKAKAAPHGQEWGGYAYGRATSCRALSSAIPAKVQEMIVLLALAGKPIKSHSSCLVQLLEKKKKNTPSAEILCRQGRTVTPGDAASFSLKVEHYHVQVQTWIKFFSLLNSRQSAQLAEAPAFCPQNRPALKEDQISAADAQQLQ